MSNTPPYQAPVDPNNPGQQQQQQWQNTGFAPPNGYAMQQMDLPGAGGVLAMGILSIVFMGIIGLVLGLVALTKGGSLIREYNNNPGRYTSSSLGRAKAGRVCAIISLSIMGLALIIVLIAVAANA